MNIAPVTGKSLFAGRRVVLFGVPGAYTGVCSSRRLTCGSVIFQLSTSRSVGVPRCSALVDSP